MGGGFKLAGTEARENEGGNRCRVYLYAVVYRVYARARVRHSHTAVSPSWPLHHRRRDHVVSSLSPPIFPPRLPPARHVISVH